MSKNLKLKFDKNQDYQLKAIDSIVDIFDGQERKKSSFSAILDTIINTDEIKWNVEELINPIKDGRSQEDVIYEILLKYGVDLSMPIEEVEIMGSKVYSVGFGYLMICLEKDISLDLIEAIGEQKPNRVVLYDNGLDNESKTNGERILKELGVKDIRTI